MIHCVFSPYGKQLTVGLDDGRIAVYDTSTWSTAFSQGPPELIKARGPVISALLRVATPALLLL